MWPWVAQFDNSNILYYSLPPATAVWSSLS